MKFLFLLLGLSLAACSGGPEQEPEPTPEQAYSASPKRPAPAPVEDDAGSTTDNHCVVYSDWINDCEVLAVYCDGKLKHLDIKCGGGYNPFSWKNIPDPPPPWVENNGSRRRSD